MGNYNIKEYSMGYLYTKKYDKEVQKVLNRLETIGIADFAYNVYDYTGQTGNPIAGVFFAALSSKYETGPSISQLKESVNLYPLELRIAEQQLDFINSNEFKYLIYSNTARKTFINELDKLIDTVEKTNFEHYNNVSDNNYFKENVVNYINQVKDLNTNYKESQKMFDSIMKLMENRKW